MTQLGDPAPGGGRCIPLTKGLVAIVDDEDFDRISKLKWNVQVKAKGGRIAACVSTSTGHRTLRMHREILGTRDGMFTDHRDGNPLNNRRENLRECEHFENCRNRKKRKGKTGFKGSYRFRNKWMAIIVCDRRSRYLGLFTTAEDAARAYDQAARELFGEFAAVNFPVNANERSCLGI